MIDILPDCMMPDGADPCQGYHQLMDEIERLKKLYTTLYEEAADKVERLHEEAGMWHSRADSYYSEIERLRAENGRLEKIAKAIRGEDET